MSSLLRGLSECESADSSDDGMSGPEEDGSTDSYICDVCSGFGERDHPRAIFNLNSDDVPGERKYRYTYFYFHYPNPVLLADSANNGCQTCELIMSDLRESWNIQLDDLTWEEVQAEAQDLENKRLATWAELMQDDTTSFDPCQDAAGLVKRIKAARLEGHSMLPSSSVHGKGRICLRVLCKSDQKSLWSISGVQAARIEIVDDPLGSMSRSALGLPFLSSPRKLHFVVSLSPRGEKRSRTIQMRQHSELTTSSRYSRSGLASPSNLRCLLLRARRAR